MFLVFGIKCRKGEFRDDVHFTSRDIKCFALFYFQPASNKIEDVLDEESSAGEGSLDGCAGKMCTANEHCCDKHVCVDADESKF